MATHAPPPPQPGRVVRVRSRRYLVDEVVATPNASDHTLVRCSCPDDDAQGIPLEALWEKEVDARIVDESVWTRVGQKGFDPPRLFSAYLNTLRWNSVTATTPTPFHAPWRASIDVSSRPYSAILRRAMPMYRAPASTSGEPNDGVVGPGDDVAKHLEGAMDSAYRWIEHRGLPATSSTVAGR